ncbi:MAG: type II toxin-antitoxin system Phd/YefM family antitoxin [Kiritimatiellae bacterium]|nr:type II toxin-antitoxin system Phd/YefM family antitoxin [Kiritimatiellia bacterium]
MTTHTVTYFKNHALRLLDQVATKGEELIITRRGKPLAHVEPIKQESMAVRLGRLKGTMHIERDIVAPLGDKDWTACR